jgi:hypothetical protein
MLQLLLLKPDRFLAATSFHTLYGALDEDWLTKIVNKLFNCLPQPANPGRARGVVAARLGLRIGQCCVKIRQVRRKL